MTGQLLSKDKTGEEAVFKVFYWLICRKERRIYQKIKICDKIINRR